MKFIDLKRQFSIISIITIQLLSIQKISFAQENEKDMALQYQENLTGNWGSVRTWLKDNGIMLKPRISQFFQVLSNADSGNGHKYGGKADIMFNADLKKLGLWKGLSLSMHAEYNFGNSLNGQGGTMVPVNVALAFPGMEGADAFDLSSVYLVQQFKKGAKVAAGKINIVDLAAGSPFMGGAGIQSFWNTSFAAPPSGTVPPYLFGVLLDVPLGKSNLGIWIYDPNSVVNKTGFENPFADGFTIRGKISIPVTIAGRTGHQSFVALYCTANGTDLQDIGDFIIPPEIPAPAGTKDFRYYFNYAFDQYLCQSVSNPKEGVGVFGQFGISDGNPNKLHWSAFAGISGTGMIKNRSRDHWGAGYYYDELSEYLVEPLQSLMPIGNEQGVNIFYNFAITPWLFTGADFQFAKPAFATSNAIYSGVRMVVNL